MRVVESGRGRKGYLDGINLGPTGTWVQIKDSKGGGTDGVSQTRLAKGTTWDARYGRETQTSGGGQRV